jgi:hypothetical protein
MDEIVERIKDVISHEYPTKKIKDKHVAFVLGLKPNNLAVMKMRGLIPYEDVVMFCIRRKVNLNWMLFGLGSMRLDDAVKSL